LTQGSPLKILILFSIVTAVLSAFLDNVTTVLIIIPIIIELTAGMGLDPRMYVISQAIISNIGGTATLIGDPPNIIIGSKVGLTFNQFMINLTLPVMVCFAAAIAYIWATNRDKFKPIDTNLAKLFSVQLLLEKIRYNFLDTKIDKIFLTKGLVCLGLAILLFVTQTITGLSPGVVAMLVAMVLFRDHAHRCGRDARRDRVEHPAFFYRPVHPGGGAGRKRRHRMDRPQHFHARGGQPLRDRADGALGVRHRLRIFGQYPLHHHHDPHRETDAGKQPHPQQHPVVGAFAGCLPGRQPDHDRGIGQHRVYWHGQKIRAGDFIPRFCKKKCRDHPDHPDHCIGLPNALLVDIVMKKQDREILCSLIRDHEDAVGSSRVTMMAIKAFIESIKQVRCSVEEVRELYSELSLAIKNTEPKVIPLIHLIEEFEKEIGESPDGTIDEIKDRAIRILESKHQKIKTKIGKLIEYGLTCISEGDVIIVHTIGYDVKNMLKLASQVLHKSFKVIVLKQDPSKTRRLIKFLEAADIDMEIIPEYSLGPLPRTG
jgi:hypothetical protein